MRCFMFVSVGIILLLSGCKKASLATVTTVTPIASEITSVSAVLHGSVLNSGNATVTARGIVVGTLPDPTITSSTNAILGSGSGDGDFLVTASGLSTGTTYYFRAYAINSVGISYGQNISFATVSQAHIFCGDSITLDCLNSEWVVAAPATGRYYILHNYYFGKNCLLLVNPHDSNQLNPQSILFKSVIKNIQPNTSYRVSCDAKIKGYPDYANNPSFSFYAYSSANWYGEFYFGSAPGVYLNSDWSNRSYIFVSGQETTLQFELSSIYDSTWVTNLVITPM